MSKQSQQVSSTVGSMRRQPHIKNKRSKAIWLLQLASYPPGGAEVSLLSQATGTELELRSMRATANPVISCNTHQS